MGHAVYILTKPHFFLQNLMVTLARKQVVCVVAGFTAYSLAAKLLQHHQSQQNETFIHYNLRILITIFFSMKSAQK